ncbi:MAG TPA: nitronate monooxygenase family protein [Dongiaceae bacterium]|jgi:nitronate monooxygenase
MWPDRRLIDLFGIEHPIVLAPMAGPSTAELAIAVAESGGLGSLATATSSPEQIRKDLGIIRQRTSKPLNLNFFTHKPPAPDAAREAKWKARLAPYYSEFAIDSAKATPGAGREPFNDAACAIVEEFKPEILSFHFGLPEQRLLDRAKATGAKIMASATTAQEARWLADHGCDVVIAQGSEAGGHRGMFLTDNVASQAGTFALLPQVVDAVKCPVIAAGGIADGRGIAAALALGAAGAQVGTAYLFCPEANVASLHRAALKTARDDSTALTNLFTGRPARGIINRLMREVGPLSPDAPAFPTAGGALAPLKAAAEAKGSADFGSLWSGQAAALGREMPAGELTRHLAREAQARLKALAG